MEPLEEIVRRNLKKFREEAGLSQEQAAEVSGVPASAIVRYESGKTDQVPGTALRLLAVVYGHSTDDFYEPSPPPAKLADRPVIFLRTMPGTVIDAEILGRVQDEIDRANALVRGKKHK